uniref:hypothetical protein n=1 Tax=Cocconeiopsis kantsiensis TaxID=3082010 RepID=UPI0030018762
MDIMFWIRVSKNRIFIVSEYYLLIPLTLIGSIAFIKKVEKAREQEKRLSEQENKTVKKQGGDKRETSKRWKIFHMAMGNLIPALQIRGGDGFGENYNYINVINENCGVEKGIRYVNNERISKIAYARFKSKQINGVIYITGTALCHLIRMYGLHLPALPTPISNFIGITDRLLFVKKTAFSLCLGVTVVLYRLYQGPIVLGVSTTSALFGLIGMIRTTDPGIQIPTEVVSVPIEFLKPRIADQPELVSVDLSPIDRDKISMSEFSKRYECSLPDQIIHNKKCRPLRPSEITDIVADADAEQPIYYEDVVKLDKVEFSDRFEVVPRPKPTTKSNLRGMKPLKKKGKMVKFLDKFADPEVIPEAEQWDITSSTSQDAPRIPGKDKEL